MSAVKRTYISEAIARRMAAKGVLVQDVMEALGLTRKQVEHVTTRMRHLDWKTWKTMEYVGIDEKRAIQLMLKSQTGPKVNGKPLREMRDERLVKDAMGRLGNV